MTEALYITVPGGGESVTLTFYSDEVRSLKVRIIQPFTLKRLQNRRPFILRYGQAYDVYTCSIRTARRSTFDKLAKLAGNDELMQLQYCNVKGESVNIAVRMACEIPEYYTGGLDEAKRDIELKFVEQ